MNIVNVTGGELRIPVRQGGGAEAYIFNISKCLSQNGHDVTVLDRKYSITDPDFEYIDGVKIVRLQARRLSLPNLTLTLTLNYIIFARQVEKYLATVNSDVVHVHVSIIGLYLAMAIRVFRERLLYTSHATRRGKTSRTLLDKMAITLENHLVKKVKRTIVLNKSVREELISKTKIKPTDISILPMGTNTDIFNPSIDLDDVRERYELRDKFIVLFVGRIREDKGLEYLVKAANTVINQSGYRDVQFVLVGPTEEFVLEQNHKSSYFERIVGLINEYNLQSHVILTGAVPFDDLRRLYTAADIFVLPSITEAAPQSVIEAMSSGKPVIGTKVGAVPTQIIDGQSGFVIDPGNDGDLSEKIIFLIDNPDEIRRMGAYARKLAEEEADWSKITTKLLQVYESALNK